MLSINFLSGRKISPKIFFASHTAAFNNRNYFYFVRRWSWEVRQGVPPPPLPCPHQCRCRNSICRRFWRCRCCCCRSTGKGVINKDYNCCRRHCNFLVKKIFTSFFWASIWCNWDLQPCTFLTSLKCLLLHSQKL